MQKVESRGLNNPQINLGAKYFGFLPRRRRIFDFDIDSFDPAQDK